MSYLKLKFVLKRTYIGLNNKMKVIFILISFLSLLFSNTNRITTSDGITCESTSESPYEVESYVENSKNDLEGEYSSEFEKVDNKISTVGIKFTYKFGEQKSLNCNRLYNLELREKTAKVEELEAKIKALQSANKINWKKVDEK